MIFQGFYKFIYIYIYIYKFIYKLFKEKAIKILAKIFPLLLSSIHVNFCNRYNRFSGFTINKIFYSFWAKLAKKSKLAVPCETFGLD